MPRPRLFIHGNLTSDSELPMGAEQTHYLGRVLRLRTGDRLTVFNGEGGEFDATITSIARNSSVLLINKKIDTTTESPLKVHLVQAVSRGERMDFVVQKATELGVKRISPVLTEHGVVKLDVRRAIRRRDHWQKIAESACEQSGRTRPPLVDTPMSLKTWFGSKTRDSDIDLILRPAARTSLVSIPAPATKVCLLIGPEGGFSGSEHEDADVAGCTPVTLGPRTLRTETAAVAAITIVQSMWGDMRS